MKNDTFSKTIAEAIVGGDLDSSEVGFRVENGMGSLVDSFWDLSTLPANYQQGCRHDELYANTVPS